MKKKHKRLGYLPSDDDDDEEDPDDGKEGGDDDVLFLTRKGKTKDETYVKGKVMHKKYKKR